MDSYLEERRKPSATVQAVWSQYFEKDYGRGKVGPSGQDQVIGVILPEWICAQLILPEKTLLVIGRKRRAGSWAISVVSPAENIIGRGSSTHPDRALLS
jgi:hypothetical protein